MEALLMRIASASLYAAACLLATPALALSPEAAERVAAARAGEMTRLVVHDAPKGPYDVAIDGPEGETGFEAFAGKVTLVNFWATWCPPCLKEMPSLDALAADMEGPDFALVAISTDRGDPAKPRGWLEENGIDALAFYHDPSNRAARAVNLLGQPTTLILDREGREIARFQGEADWASEDARALIEAVIAETEPAG
jgi:thiol-disulfide isomerase/thioredoxin